MLKKTIVGAAFVVFAFTVITPAPAYARVHVGRCITHKHTGGSTRLTKETAIFFARVFWRSGVFAHKHPKEYTKWENSVAQRLSCRREKIRYFRCTFQAYPCKRRPRLFMAPSTKKRIWRGKMQTPKPRTVQ